MQKSNPIQPSFNIYTITPKNFLDLIKQLRQKIRDIHTKRSNILHPLNYKYIEQLIAFQKKIINQIESEVAFVHDVNPPYVESIIIKDPKTYINQLFDKNPQLKKKNKEVLLLKECNIKMDIRITDKRLMHPISKFIKYLVQFFNTTNPLVYRMNETHQDFHKLFIFIANNLQIETKIAVKSKEEKAEREKERIQNIINSLKNFRKATKAIKVPSSQRSRCLII